MLDFHIWPHYISVYGYLAVFLLSIVEGPLVTVFAAFLAAQGMLNVFAVYVAVVAGDLVGDVLTYGIGRWFVGRLPWRFGIRSRAVRQHIETLRTHIHARTIHILLFGKLTHSVGFAVLLAAGAARVRLGAFILYNFLGTLLKSFVFIIIGYFFGRFYKDFSVQFQTGSLIGLGLVMLMMMYLMRRLCVSDNDRKGLE